MVCGARDFHAENKMDVSAYTVYMACEIDFSSTVQLMVYKCAAVIRLPAMFIHIHHYYNNKKGLASADI